MPEKTEIWHCRRHICECVHSQSTFNQPGFFWPAAVWGDRPSRPFGPPLDPPLHAARSAHHELRPIRPCLADNLINLKSLDVAGLKGCLKDATHFSYSDTNLTILGAYRLHAEQKAYLPSLFRYLRSSVVSISVLRFHSPEDATCYALPESISRRGRMHKHNVVI